MNAVPLYRLLQVSDLHFGDLDNGGATSSPNAPSPRWITAHQILDGQLGHHVRGIRALWNFKRDLEKTAIPFDMVVTGDVTSNGSIQQFELVDAFLGGKIPTPLGVSLGRPDWACSGIPGNHDQWPGSNLVVGRPTAGLAACLPWTLPRAPVSFLANGMRVRFIYLDTDADVHPYGPNRILARGAFLSQLAALQEMPSIEPGEVRVLVMHHSITGWHTALPQPGAPHPFVPFPVQPRASWATMEIEPTSAAMVRRFIVDHSVSVVLCGHMHTASLSLLEGTNNNQVGRYLEARCGSTTIRDRHRYEDQALMPQGRKLPPNTLILHELVEDQGRYFWQADVYWLSRRNRFVQQVPHVSPLLPSFLGADIEVA